jgi:putative transposase
VLQAHGVSISRDGKGCALDHIFVERLWRSVKYEEIYLKHYESMKEAREGLSTYFRFYNTQRSHQALGNRTPAEVYETGGVPIPSTA